MLAARGIALNQNIAYYLNHCEQPMPPDAPIDDPYVRISLELRLSTLDWLDGLKEEWGIRSRSELVSRLLDELNPLDSN